jgi:thiol peroxidase
VDPHYKIATGENMIKLIGTTLLFISFLAQAAPQGITVNKESVRPGSSVKLRGKEIPLHKGSLKLGDNLAAMMKKAQVDFPFKNKVSVVITVPSIKTPVCDRQAHILGENKKLKSGIDLFTISRDLSSEQKSFAKEANLENIKYVSDAKSASFGKLSGLLIPSSSKLARSVMVLDQKGVIRYMQVVPELTELPDMEKAFEFANQIL